MSLNLNEIFAMLSDKVPAWGPLIGMLEFRESKDAAPVASDGRVIYYNTKKMQYYTPSTQMFYFAQQLLHIQLAHQQRGEGRDPDLWRRATDDVVSEMLIADILYDLGIRFKYETILVSGRKLMYPDFEFIHPKERRIIWLEHQGLIDDPKYAVDAFEKQDNYGRIHRKHPGDLDPLPLSA